MRKQRTDGRLRVCVGLIACSLMLASSWVAAQDRLAEHGRSIALTRCSICHAIEGNDSPHRASPPFNSLDQDFPIAMLEDALRTGVISGHDEMPMFEFSRHDIIALMAYIDSLAPADKRYLIQPR